MKLRTKLMLAPASVGALLLVTLGASIWVLTHSSERSDQVHKHVLATLSNVTAVQTTLSQIHTQVYRTVAIAQALDDKAIKLRREQQSQQLGALIAQTGGSADLLSDSEIKKDLVGFAALAAKYQKSADAAVDMASADANTGVAAMQSADVDFRDLNAVLARVLDNVHARADSLDRELIDITHLQNVQAVLP